MPDAQNEPNAKVELYDLTADPHEEQNLSAANPQRVAQLRSMLDTWWNPAER